MGRKREENGRNGERKPQRKKKGKKMQTGKLVSGSVHLVPMAERLSALAGPLIRTLAGLMTGPCIFNFMAICMKWRINPVKPLVPRINYVPENRMSQ